MTPIRVAIQHHMVQIHRRTEMKARNIVEFSDGIYVNIACGSKERDETINAIINKVVTAINGNFVED